MTAVKYKVSVCFDIHRALIAGWLSVLFFFPQPRLTLSLLRFSTNTIAAGLYFCYPSQDDFTHAAFLSLRLYTSSITNEILEYYEVVQKHTHHLASASFADEVATWSG
jgi:hypothetical protein